MARRRDKGEERRIARQRVVRLLTLARREALGPDADLADRYAELALRVALRYQMPLTPEEKVQVCRRCHAYQVPGRTSRTRIQSGRVAVTCLRCGDVRRRPLAPRTERPPRAQKKRDAAPAVPDAGRAPPRSGSARTPAADAPRTQQQPVQDARGRPRRTIHVPEDPR